MSEPAPDRPSRAVVQLVTTGAVGIVVLPVIGMAALWAGFVAALPGLITAGVVGLCVMLACLIATVAVTREATVLGESAGRRLLWALLVLGGGLAGWAFGWAVGDAGWLGSSSGRLFGWVPFVLAAGVLLRRRVYRFAALGVLVALAATGVVLLRQVSPGELDARLLAEGVYRDSAYAVAIPGYRPTDRDYGGGVGGGEFQPVDPAAVPAPKFISVVAYQRAFPNEQLCGQPTAVDSRLYWGECTKEPGGLVYRHNEIMHGYQVRIGQRYVEVHGTPGVPHELLRQAALSLHPATRAELGGAEPTADHFAVTVPGYVGLPTGAPVGMSFRPANPAGNGPRSVVIRLYAQSAATDVCFGTTECTPDGDGLTYLRYEEEHGFTVRHGSIDVLVLGGLSTDRALLRQAVLAARPATDDQLRRALPPQRPGTGIERFRDWLRSL